MDEAGIQVYTIQTYNKQTKISLLSSKVWNVTIPNYFDYVVLTKKKYFDKK